MNRADTTSLINAKTIGVLSDTEVVLVSNFQGKRVLRSTLLPFDASEPGGFLRSCGRRG